MANDCLIADISGHGIPAALIAMVKISFMAVICSALHKTNDAIEYCNKILEADPSNIKAQKLLQKLSH